MKFTANDFTTVLPETWEDRTMITLLAPFEPGQFATNIVINKYFVEGTESIEDFAAEQTELLRQNLADFELLDSRTATINDYPACQQLHRFRAENGVIQQVQTFLLINRAIYMITGTSSIQDFNQHLLAFRQVVENFMIRD